MNECRHDPNIVGTLLEGPLCRFDTLLDLVHGS